MALKIFNFSWFVAGMKKELIFIDFVSCKFAKLIY